MKFIPALTILFFTSFTTFSQTNDSLKTRNDSKSNKKDEAFVYVDVMPEYPSGNQALLEFIGKNIKYPKKARKAGITGKGFYKFVVDTNGLVTKIEIARGVPNCPACDKEAIRVFKKLKFIPGMNKGKKVPVWFQMPINFTLRD